MSGYEQRPGDFRIICDFSGFKGWASDTVKTHEGFRVLKRFAGQETQRHPQENVRARPDRQSVPWSRPEGPDVFVTGFASVLLTEGGLAITASDGLSITVTA